MLRFCVNLSLLFTEHPLDERFAAAAACGFDAVEIQFPYTLPANRLVELLHQHQQQLVLFNLPAGDWEKGERGIACHPDRAEEFKAGVQQALEYALATGCRRINCLAGVPPEGVGKALAYDTLKTNLSVAASTLGPHGITLCVEPINTRDIPGFLLNRSDEALSLLSSLEAPNLRLQYDIYHMQIMEGDISRRLQQLLPEIGHIQLADPPDRHQPGTGELNIPYLLNHLDRLGYTGWVGLEYVPLTTSANSFDWLHSYRHSLGTGNERNHIN